MYFSKSTGGFYLSGVHVIPDDAVEISKEHHDALMQGQSNGRWISSTSDGLPILIDPPPYEPTYEEELAILNSDYQKDVDALNHSWATALLADGPNEAVKLTAIRSQYTARKGQYSADYTVLRNKYQK